MDTFIAASVLILLLGVVLVLIERNHRRTFGLPRAPFGADVEHEADLARVLHDIDANRAHFA